MEFLNLDHRIMPVPVDYVRELYDYISELYAEIEDLNGKLARSGNQFYQRDAAAMGKKWQELNIEFGTLQREKIENEARLQAEIDRLTFLNQQLAADLDIAEARLKGMVAVEVVENKPKRALPERDSNGKFSAAKSREEIAMEHHEKGYRNTEIAQMMGVSPDTIARYLRNYSQKQEEMFKQKLAISAKYDSEKEEISDRNFEEYGFSCVF